MPKELRSSATYRPSPIQLPSSRQSATPQGQTGHRNAAIWNEEDDQILISARASGLNWQPIALTHFPNKTANACRKRHERLMERRQHDDWDGHKLDALAAEYMECRKEMWSILAAKVGERWALVEAKCMEKGLKNLQSMARAAQKRSRTMTRENLRGNEEDQHEGDSGIGVSDDEITHPPQSELQPLQQGESSGEQAQRHLPPPLPLYQPPMSVMTRAANIGRPHDGHAFSGTNASREAVCRGPDEQGQRGVSIRSMLSEGMPGR